MKKFRALFITAVVAAAALGSFANEATVDPQFVEIAKSMENGWNRKSGAEFARRFAADADYVVVNGMYLQGRVLIASVHQIIFDTVYKDSKLKVEIERTRMIRPDVAIVHIAGELVVGSGKESSTRYTRVTLVLAKRDGKWEISAFHNTPVSTEGGK